MNTTTNNLPPQPSFPPLSNFPEDRARPFAEPTARQTSRSPEFWLGIISGITELQGAGTINAEQMVTAIRDALARMHKLQRGQNG